MSGAEAVLGVIAGGAGLASLSIQLAESAIKLRRVYNAAKNAPKQLRKLAEALETVQLALQMISTYGVRESARLILSRCIRECETDSEAARQLTDKLERRIASPGGVFGKLQAAFAQKEIEDLLNNLERSKSTLALVHAMYVAEHQVYHQQALHATLARLAPLTEGSSSRAVSQSITTISSTSQQHSAHGTLVGSRAEHDADLVLKNRPRGLKKTRMLHYRATLPHWLSNQIWDFAVKNTLNRWTMTITTYHTISAFSLVSIYCEMGNLEGVRYLFRHGRASHLDVVDGHTTLLELAAQEGHIELCQYLLDDFVYPDQPAVLNGALSMAETVRATSKPISRLLFNHKEFQADVLLDERQSPWVGSHQIRPSVFDPLLRHMETLLPTERISMALRFTETAFQDFLRLAGVEECDPQLALWRAEDGMTVLHYIAGRLSREDQLPVRETRQWTRLGALVLKNGADPSGIWSVSGTGQPNPGITPFQILIRAHLERLHTTCPDVDPCITSIESWTSLLRAADLNVTKCGLMEVTAWRQHGHLDCKQIVHLDDEGVRISKAVGLLCGHESSDWDLEVVTVSRRSSYAVNQGPGAWPSHSVPHITAWKPTNRESREGAWSVHKESTHTSNKSSLRNWPRTEEALEAFEYLACAQQDDWGLMVQCDQRIRRYSRLESRSRPRSRSQPPVLRHPEWTYRQGHTGFVPWTRWWQMFHRCRLDSTWQCGCPPDHLDYCLRVMPGSVQQTSNWKSSSFLAEIVECQEGWDLVGRRSEHTGKADCPKRCSRVDLAALNVPHDLREHHPVPFRWRVGMQEEVAVQEAKLGLTENRAGYSRYQY